MLGTWALGGVESEAGWLQVVSALAALQEAAAATGGHQPTATELALPTLALG